MKKKTLNLLLGLFIVFSFAVLYFSSSNIVLNETTKLTFGFIWFGVFLSITFYAALADHEKMKMESKKRLEENKKRLEEEEKQQALAKLNNTIFLDTSTIIGGGIDFLERTSKVANLFITDIVLQELDGLKNAEGDTGYKAREIYRQFAPATTKELYELPDRTELKRDDTLFEMTLPSGLVFYTIHRSRYKTRDINDSKIIEVANDYKGTLATIDIAQSVRAKSVGCEVKIIQEDELLAGNSVGQSSTISSLHSKEVGNPNASGLMWAGSISLVLGIFMMNETFAPFLITGGIMLLIFGYMTADEKTKKKWKSKKSNTFSDSSSDCIYTSPSHMGYSSNIYSSD